MAEANIRQDPFNLSISQTNSSSDIGLKKHSTDVSRDKVHMEKFAPLKSKILYSKMVAPPELNNSYRPMTQHSRKMISYQISNQMSTRCTNQTPCNSK